MQKIIIQTDKAPSAIGAYSQAVKVGDVVYASGQIPLDPHSMAIVSNDFAAQTAQVFNNLQAVIEAAGGSLNDAVKLTIYLTDLANFNTVNELMGQFFTQPFPARATVQVAALPKQSQIEIDAVFHIE